MNEEAIARVGATAPQDKNKLIIMWSFSFFVNQMTKQVQLYSDFPKYNSLRFFFSGLSPKIITLSFCEPKNYTGILNPNFISDNRISHFGFGLQTIIISDH